MWTSAGTTTTLRYPFVLLLIFSSSAILSPFLSIGYPTEANTTRGSTISFGRTGTCEYSAKQRCYPADWIRCRRAWCGLWAFLNRWPRYRCRWHTYWGAPQKICDLRWKVCGGCRSVCVSNRRNHGKLRTSSRISPLPRSAFISVPSWCRTRSTRLSRIGYRCSISYTESSTRPGLLPVLNSDKQRRTEVYRLSVVK